VSERRPFRGGFLLLGGALLALSAGCATTKTTPDQTRARAGIPCGIYRWRIKTLSDPEASGIRWKPIDTTIKDLVTMTPPAWFDRRRRNANEFYVYRVRAILAKVHRNIDQDYHLLLRDPDDPSYRLVAEIPSPSCARAMARYSEVRANRLAARALTAHHAQSLVEVVGVGFFDSFHTARGSARNGFELHPVLQLTEIHSTPERLAAR
jgi:hypothetical protein